MEEFRKVFTSFSGSLAIMVAAVPTALGWTDVIPSMGGVQGKFGQALVSIVSFLCIGLVYHYRNGIFGGHVDSFGAKILNFLVNIFLILSPILLIVSMYFYFILTDQAESVRSFRPVFYYMCIFAIPSLALALMAMKQYLVAEVEKDKAEAGDGQAASTTPPSATPPDAPASSA